MIPSLLVSHFHIFVWILRTVMYQYVEAHPGPSEATKFFFVFKLTFLIIFTKSTTVDIWKALITPLTC